jgi:nitroreductase
MFAMSNQPELLSALSERRAKRAFSPAAVPAALQEVLWRAFSVAPSRGNTQAARLLVAEDNPTHAAVVAALSEGNRVWGAEAPLFVAITTRPDADALAKPGTVGRDAWSFDAGIATGNLLAQATALNLVAHPVAGFDEAGVRAAFGAPNDLRVLAVVAIGIPGEVESLPEDLQERETAPQSRIPLDVLVASEQWTDRNALTARELREKL